MFSRIELRKERRCVYSRCFLIQRRCRFVRSARSHTKGNNMQPSKKSINAIPSSTCSCQSRRWYMQEGLSDEKKSEPQERAIYIVTSIVSSPASSAFCLSGSGTTTPRPRPASNSRLTSGPMSLCPRTSRRSKSASRWSSVMSLR